MLASWRAIGREQVQLDVFLDDITIASAGPSASSLVVDMVGAFEDVVSVVEHDLNARIHPSKTQVVSSSRVVTDRLGRLCAGRPAGSMLDAYTLLGVDLRQAGRWSRRKGVLSARRLRMRAAGQRQRRYMLFRRLAGSRAACLF